MMRFEKELQQKEMRHEMKARLTQLQRNNSTQLQHQQQQQSIENLIHANRPQINIVDSMRGAHSRSPLTPNSMEELLPMVDETQEEFTSLFSTRPSASYSGPCSSTEGLLNHS